MISLLVTDANWEAIFSRVALLTLFTILVYQQQQQQQQFIGIPI